MAFDGAHAEVVAGDDAVVGVGGVHVGAFAVDDGAVVDAVGEEVAGVDAGDVGDVLGGVGDGVDFGRVLEGVEHGLADEGAAAFFLDGGAVEEFSEHVVFVVVVGELGPFVGAIGEDDEAAVAGEVGVVGVAPVVGVVVDADGEVGVLFVDEVAAGANFGDAVEEEGGFVVDVLLRCEMMTGSWRAGQAEEEGGGVAGTGLEGMTGEGGDGFAMEVVGAEVGDGFVGVVLVLGPDDFGAVGLEVARRGAGR